jgi:hypothetical protein
VSAGGLHRNWRQRLRTEIVWLVLAKLAMLLTLWALFFSPAQRPVVDAHIAASRFAVAAQPAAIPARYPDPRSETP